MNITKAQLKQIIKEELDLVLERTDVRSQRELIGPAQGQFTADDLEKARQAAMAKLGSDEREAMRVANSFSPEQHIKQIEDYLKSLGYNILQINKIIPKLSSSGGGTGPNTRKYPILADAEEYAEEVLKQQAIAAKGAAAAEKEAKDDAEFLKDNVIPFLIKNIDKYIGKINDENDRLNVPRISKVDLVNKLENLKNKSNTEIRSRKADFERILGPTVFSQVFNNKRGVMQKLANFFSKGGTYSQ